MNPCAVYDFTLFEYIDNPSKVIDILKPHCKKWAFQLEECPSTGTLHYQGRVSLKVKARADAARKRFAFRKWKLTITSKDTALSGNFFYVMKEDTRVKGPWSDQNWTYIPKDVRNIVNLYKWQQSCVDLLSNYDERSINVIINPRGGIGKTLLARYCVCNKIAELLPLVNDANSIMRMAFGVPRCGAYIFDMPRAMNKDRLYQFYSAVELLKSGYIYDDRYSFKRELIDRPNILIFTNVVPDTSLLSKDMWRLWTVLGNNLVRYINSHEDVLEQLK